MDNICKTYTRSPQNLETYEVFIEDSYQDPRFFDIRILPDVLSYGKHLFSIGLLFDDNGEYQLKLGSEIQIEIKDYDGRIIYHELIPGNSISKTGVGYIWLREDLSRYFKIEELEDSKCTITLLGELGGVPKEWEGIYNVRMQIPLMIRKDYPNNSPLYFYNQPLLKSSETTYGDIDNSYYTRSFSTFKIDNINLMGGNWKFGEIYYNPYSSSIDDRKILDTFEITSSVEMLRDNISNVGVTGLLDDTGNSNQTNTDEWIGNFSSSKQVNNWKYSGGQIGGNSAMLPYALLQTGSNSNAYKLFRYAHDYEEYEIKYKISGSGDIVIKTSPIDTDLTSSLTSYGEDTENIKTVYTRSFYGFNPNNNLTWTSSKLDNSIEIMSGSTSAIIKGEFCIPSSSYATIWLNCTNNTLSSSWSEVSIKPKELKGVSPPFYYHKVQSPLERRLDQYSFELRFLNPEMELAKDLYINGKNIVATSSVFVTGSPFIMESDDNLIAAGALKSPGYLGYHSASLGTGSGFIIYSGSVLGGGLGGTEYESDEVGLELAGGPQSEGSGSLKFSTKTGILEITGSFATTGDGIFSGSISASSGQIGGWDIHAHKLKTTGFELADSTNQYILSGSNFQVDTSGFVTASGVTINVTPDKPYLIISGSKSGSMKIDERGDFKIDTLSGSFKITGSKFELRDKHTDKITILNVSQSGQLEVETGTGTKSMILKPVSNGAYVGARGMVIGNPSFMSETTFPVAHLHTKANVLRTLFGDTGITSHASLPANTTLLLEADYGNALTMAAEQMGAGSSDVRYQFLNFISVGVSGTSRTTHTDFQLKTTHQGHSSGTSQIQLYAGGDVIWSAGWQGSGDVESFDISKPLVLSKPIYGPTAGLVVSSSNTTLIPFSVEHPQSGSLFSTYADDGGGSLVVSGTLNTHKIQSTGSAAVVSINDSVNVTGNITASGNIVANGNIIANQYIVSSSVTYMTSSFMSGSTQFGDSVDDIHTFTGSYIQMSSSTGDTTFTVKGDISGSSEFLLVGSASIGDSTAAAPNHGLYISGSVSSSNHISASVFHTPLGLTSSIHALTASHALNSAGGGGGGISFDGSTADGVLTYKDSDEATVESNMTFDGSNLSVGGYITGSSITSSGHIKLGGTVYFSGSHASNIPYTFGNYSETADGSTGVSLGFLISTGSSVLDSVVRISGSDGDGFVGIGTPYNSTLTDALTVKGNISASGDIIGVSGSFAHMSGSETGSFTHGYIADRLGVNAKNPSRTLQVAGDVGVANYIYHVGDDDTYYLMENDKINLVAGGKSMIKLDYGGSNDKILINNTNADIDFWVNANDGTAYLFGDANNKRFGINQNPTAGDQLPEALTVEGNISASGDLYLEGSISASSGAITGSGLQSLGNITAAGHITSSGAITGSGVQSLGNITAAGHITSSGAITGSGLQSLGKITAAGHITSSGAITGSGVQSLGKLTTADYISSSKELLLHGSASIGNTTAAPHHGLYVSSSISASSALFGQGSTFVSMSRGHISASGTITGSGLDISGGSTGELEVAGTISASSFITASVFYTPLGLTSSIHALTASYAHNAGGGAMTSFQLEDGDGTEVAISDAKEVKFVEGGGIDINWTDTDNGTDGDPYDLTFTIDAAQTGITSVLATDLKIGEDDQTKVDFETINEVHIYADNAQRVNVKSTGVDVSGVIYATGQITSSGAITGSGLQSLGNITAAGSITSSGAITGSGIQGTNISGSDTGSFSHLVVDGNATARLNVDGIISGSGAIYADSALGYHGYDDFIPLHPGDFGVGAATREIGNITDDDGGSIESSNASYNFYGFKLIPRGFTATSGVIYGNNTSATHTWLFSTVTASTAVTIGSATAIDTTKDFTDVVGDGIEYIIVKIDAAASTDNFYGGKIFLSRS